MQVDNSYLFYKLRELAFLKGKTFVKENLCSAMDLTRPVHPRSVPAPGGRDWAAEPAAVHDRVP
jgi:hypothetical protein